MGRSSNSRNRIFTHENGILRTEAADLSIVEDPSLIIYNAMRDLDDCIVISNGNHTDTICKGLEKGKSFYTINNIFIFYSIFEKNKTKIIQQKKL